MILWYSLSAALKTAVNPSVNCKGSVVCLVVDIGRVLVGRIGGGKEFKSGAKQQPSLEARWTVVRRTESARLYNMLLPSIVADRREK